MSTLSSIFDLIVKEVDSKSALVLSILGSIAVLFVVVNIIWLVCKSNYWSKMRNKSEYINDADRKTATTNYIKYALCTFVLFTEIMLVFLNAISQILTITTCSVTNYYPVMCPMFHRLIDSFVLIWLILPISTVNMLCLFLIEVIVNSKVDIDILRREIWKTFWLCIFAFAISETAFEMTFFTNIGNIITSVIEIYLCQKLYQIVKKLFIALKSKCIDYTFELKKFKHFRSQVRHFKWSSLVIGISFSTFIISNAVLRILESIDSILFDFIRPYLSESTYQSFTFIPRFGEKALTVIERISILNLALVYVAFNCILFITIMRQVLRYRRFMSRPFHIKLVDIRDGHIVYKRVPY